MRFCSNCGARIETNNRYCPYCGAAIKEQVPVHEQPTATPVNNPPVYGQPTAPYTASPMQAVAYPMKWFKFLIYFSLFFGAFINLVNGFNYLTGGIYFSQTDGQVTAEMVYAIYGDDLKMLDMFYGVMLIATAGLSIYARQHLAKYKADGPTLLYILYGTGAVLSLFYNIAQRVVVNVGFGAMSSSYVLGYFIGSLALPILMVVLNYVYFKKRKALFVN